MPTTTCPDVEWKCHPAPAPHLARAIEWISWISFAERVAQALRRTGYSDLTRIEVSVRTGAVLLKGSVASYHLKQLAQETVRQVFGEAAIRNELEVNYCSET